MKPDPVDTYPSSSENLATLIPGEIFRACGLPGATFTYPVYIICVCLKKAKQRPDIKGQPVWWKICRPGGVFSKLKPGENTDASGSVTEGRNIGQNNIHAFECLISFAFSHLYKGNDGGKDMLAPRVYAAFKIITTIINFKYPHEERDSLSKYCIK